MPLCYSGELAGVATSIAWTACGLAFALAARRIGALAVNQIRTAMAVVILVGVHTVVYGTPLPALPPAQFALLATSGVVGLALGDLCYFHCIGVLGPRLGSVLMATNPVLCVLLAWPVLGEVPAGRSVAGVALVVAGVIVVLSERGATREWQPGEAGASRRVAVLAGLLGALGQAGGLVLAKLGMGAMQADGAGVGVPALSATLVRMVAAAPAIVLIAWLGGHLRTTWSAVHDRRAMAATTVGVVFGPTLGVWLSMVAVAYAPAGVAATLMSLSPILMLPVAKLAYGARLGGRAWAGTMTAVAGTSVLFLGTE